MNLVTLPYSKNYITHANEIHAWCAANKIKANTISNSYPAGMDWQVEDDKERMMFILKWGSK